MEAGEGAAQATAHQAAADDRVTTSQRDTNGHVSNTEEDGVPVNDTTHGDVRAEEGQQQDADDSTSTTVRPNPEPSTKRRESQATLETPEITERPQSKKRKRAPSPPWQFPTAEKTTLQSADGRRISARFNSTNNATPVTSENESRARSSSLSAPPRSSRAASPPWKKFSAEGPSAMVVDGKRKSGRVNRELAGEGPPKRVSPRNKKVANVEQSHTNGNVKASKEKTHSRKVSEVTPKTEGQRSRGESTAFDRTATKLAELQARLAQAQFEPSRSFPPEAVPQTSHKRKRSSGTNLAQLDGTISPPVHRKTPRPPKEPKSPTTANKPTPKLKLRFTAGRHNIPPPHPNALRPSPVYPPSLSIHQLLDDADLREMQQPYMENERGPPDLAWFRQRAVRQAEEESAMRRRILNAAEPGGVLSREQCSIYKEEIVEQPEPPKVYTHIDHLMNHMQNFRHLQVREARDHKLLAKKIANEALEYWKMKRGPTEEDIQAEQDRTFKLIMKQVVADVKAKWELVAQHVYNKRLQAWEAEEDVRRQERLQEKLAKSQSMVARQRGTMDEDDLDEVDDVDNDDVEQSGESASSESDDEENFSESDSDENDQADGEGDEGEMDQAAIDAYKAQMEADPPPAGDEEGPEDDAEYDITMTNEPAASARASEQQSEAEPSPQPDAKLADVLMKESLDDDQSEEDYQPAEEEAQSDAGDDEEGLATDAESQARRQRRSSAAIEAEGDTAGLSDDDSTDMDSDDYDSDDEASGMDDEDEENAGENPLLGFLSRPEIEQLKSTGLPTPTTSAEGDSGDSGRLINDDAAMDAAGGAEAELDDRPLDGTVAEAEAASEKEPEEQQKPDASTADKVEAAAREWNADHQSKEEPQEAAAAEATTSEPPRELNGGPSETANGGPEALEHAGHSAAQAPIESEMVRNDDREALQAPGQDVHQREAADHDLALALDFEAYEQAEVEIEREAPASIAVRATSPALQESQEAISGHFVPQPVLLRGKLRSYQHAGLNWLASLYRNGTNGILADEMGLGKTIQTIAVLAHLAEEYGCWETHLVIVPTSVVLNWVTEFQKFLPGFRVLAYYGTSEERQAKRRGWTNDPHLDDKSKRGYNVVITSYNIAMQDINALRNVSWHYLVLDEAHNIRNFNSQRWQILIRLKTQARLLLTGTPLQNSLTELWSLLTFLTAGDDDPAQGDLEEFLSHWKGPVSEIFEKGVTSLSAEAQQVIDQLHISLRPFLLRRLKSEVEKDLPKKTESVVVCKLSKRQRQLYQEYMGLAEVKKSLVQGNAVSAGKVLLSLRRVCNHPDLFDPRGVESSWGMERSVAEEFGVQAAVVGNLLGGKREVPSMLVVVGNEGKGRYAGKRARQLDAKAKLSAQLKRFEASQQQLTASDPSTLEGCRALRRVRAREEELEHLRSLIRYSDDNLAGTPIYGSDLQELVTIKHDRPYKVNVPPPPRPYGQAPPRIPLPTVRSLRGWPQLGSRPLHFKSEHPTDWLLAKDSMLQHSAQTHDSIGEKLRDTLTRFAFVTPAVTAPVLDYLIPTYTQRNLRTTSAYPTETDYAHEARIRLSIAFPDSRLLVYDSGKLQRLTHLLRELQAKGSRSLIFTQMTGTLNILEQFLSLMGLPYLRLDGSTSPERRHLYAQEFNRADSKYQCMILSSRAGGVGLNLTGASSVIFYDLDWNPQMDRQCMDRAHRIGQVRDVEVFKMVSEKTVEENILRRAEQKSLLDQTVIQEGHFTTDYEIETPKDAKGDGDGEDGEEVAAAIARFLGNGNGNSNDPNSNSSTTAALESVEDKEDVAAAQRAHKEEYQDDQDFGGAAGSYQRSGRATPANPEADKVQEVEALVKQQGSLDGYLVRFGEWMVRDVVFVPPVKRKERRDRKRR